MGWKSTIDLTRQQAISAILKAKFKNEIDPFAYISNKELEDMMSIYRIGDDSELDYFGHNFNIFDSQKEIDLINEE